MDLTKAIEFAVGVAGPLNVLVTYILRQVINVSGSAARAVVWVLSFLLALFALVMQHMGPAIKWGTAEEIVTSIASIGAFMVASTTVATAVYKVLDVANWSTVDARTAKTEEPKPTE